MAYFCYDLDRYSTDIDLDLLDHAYEQEVMNEMTALLSRIGEIKSFTRGADLHRWIFRYDERSTNIKVELNKRDLIHNHYEVKTIQGVDILCMDTVSMVTNKLLALSDRRYNRDLFDTYFFRKKNYDYDEKIIQARTGKSLTELLANIIQELPEHYAINTLLGDGMGDVLTDAQKPRVKNHLIPETIKLLQLYLKETRKNSRIK
ncbi:nucleotidyl transferase AbiEii/AbiGii toxin family protein [Patescibacteria group bacterium]|nr:nucleotidyl transferase AbiEii/AbiGii toxin family protein [Patescibacteria group bacterium]